MFNRLILCFIAFLGNAVELFPEEAFLSYESLNFLICNGNVNVIMGGDSDNNVIEYDPNQASVSIAPSGLVEIQSEQEEATVVIRSNNRFKELGTLFMQDNSSLIARDLESDSLAIDTRSAGNVVIEGVMNLNSLKVSSNSEVEIYWVDSKRLDVVSDEGSILLAGVSDFTTIRSSGQSKIDASGILSERVWVSATDNAELSVFPTQELFAYTRDDSKLDVKNNPKVFVPLNQSPSVIVLNYVEMEKRATAQKLRDKSYQQN